MRVAASVRRAKECEPRRYCTSPRCLWLVEHRDGRRTPCPKHMPPDSAQVVRGIVRLLTADCDGTIAYAASGTSTEVPWSAPSIAERVARFTTERITDAGIVSRTTFSELWTVTESGAEHRHLVTIRTDDTGRETIQCQTHPGRCVACAAVTATRLQNALTGKDA